MNGLTVSIIWISMNMCRATPKNLSYATIRAVYVSASPLGEVSYVELCGTNVCVPLPRVFFSNHGMLQHAHRGPYDTNPDWPVSN